MSHNVEVPDALYAQLALVARRRGQTPEDLLLTALRQLVPPDEHTDSNQDELPLPPDPIEPFIGAFTWGVGDLGERHDDYLAKAHAQAAAGKGTSV